MNTAYRMYNPEDIDPLVEFWNQNAGWDQIDRRQWETRFYHTPFGHSSVVLAEDKDSNEILGQFVFIPSVVNIDGREVKGFRPFAPVVKESVRSKMGFVKVAEIVLNMYNFAVDQFKKEGVGLMHMLPDPRWSRAFQFLRDVQTGYFPLWSLPLPLNKSFDIPEGFEVEPVKPTDEHINDLWNKANRLYGCMLNRSAKALPWKIRYSSYQMLSVLKDKELIGFSASRGIRDNQWLICDMLTADGNESLLTTIKATCNMGQEFATTHEEAAIRKVAVLATPLIQQQIETLDFKKDTYQFPVVIQVLDSSLSKEQVAPERWYVSAND
jgi:hypothetical protein